MKVIITGSTGMVGKGVLYECIEHPMVTGILVVNRNSVGIQHPKVKEVLLNDFSNLESIKEHLIGYDACFHCMGTSVVGKNEATYTKVTFEYSKTLAELLHESNPDSVFNYVSGTGTDSSEQGRSMWARIKGKTENYILNKGFKDAYMFRPGAIIPEKGIKSRTGWYNFFYIIMQPFFPLMKKSKNITTTTKIGQAMINSVLHPQKDKILENNAINSLSLIH